MPRYLISFDDGSMDRGRNPVILRLLELLGLDLDMRPELEPYRSSAIRNHAGVTVGETRTPPMAVRVITSNTESSAPGPKSASSTPIGDP